MKIDENARFPQPVLSSTTGDYLSGEFEMRFAVGESIDKGHVTIDYTVKLTEPTILSMVTSEHAGLGIFVTCGDTFYNRLVPLGLSGGRLNFEPGALLGRVSVRPIIWTKLGVENYSLANSHPEFGGGEFNFVPGSVLGLDQLIYINVGREKLAQMETIFSVAEAPALPAGTLAVNLESDKIRVLVATDVYATVNTLRGLVYGRPIILNSVFLPALMQVLDVVRDETTVHEDKRWFRVVQGKCDHLQINMLDPDLWRDSQRLLHSPFLEIHNSREIADS